MKKIMVYVEGFHDLAVIGKCFNHLKMNQINEKQILSKTFEKLLPTQYPFSPDGQLERIADIPDFYKYNDDIEIALKSANKESKIYSNLIKDLKRIEKRKNLSEISKIIIIIDADGKDAKDKIVEFNKNYTKKIDEQDLSINLENIEYKEIEIPIEFYVFPDNKNKGVLEDIIINCIPTEFITEAEKFVETMIEKSEKANETLKKGYSSKKKAVISCLGNTKILPSASGTVYLNKSNWIDDNIESNTELQKIINFLRKAFEI